MLIRLLNQIDGEYLQGSLSIANARKALNGLNPPWFLIASKSSVGFLMPMDSRIAKELELSSESSLTNRPLPLASTSYVCIVEDD